jgi:tetratricopeptide (TPR) repeat protein
MKPLRPICCLCFLMIAGQVFSQCPDRFSLMTTMVQLKNSDEPFDVQKTLMLEYVAQMNKCPVAHDTVKVHILQRTGALSYLLGDFNDAVYYTEQAVGLLKTVPDALANHPLMMKMYHYLGIFYDSLQYTTRKMQAIDSSIYYGLLSGAINNEIINDLMQRVDYTFSIGDYARCISDARMAEDLTTKFGTGVDRSMYSQIFFSHRVNSLVELGDTDAAEELVKKKLNEYIEAGERKLCGTLYNQLAKIFINKSRYIDALKAYELSFECNKLLGFSLGCKQSLNNIGFFYFVHLDNPVQALHYYKKALKHHAQNTWEADLDNIENANIIGNIANVYVHRNMFDSAFYYFDKAFNTAVNGYNEDRILQIPADQFVRLPYIHYLTGLVKDKADAHLKSYRLHQNVNSIDEAIRIYRVADELLTRIKDGQRELLSQLTWRRSARTIYEHAIEACYTANRREDAFFFFERSRAVLLNDRLSINRMSAPGRQMEIASTQRRIDQLNLELTHMRPDSPGVLSHRTEIYSLTRRKDQLSMGLSRSDEHTQNVFSTHQLAERLLGKGNSLVEIFSGDSAVYMMFITTDTLILAKVEKARYDSLTVAFIRLLSDPKLLNSRYKDFVTTSHALYNLLFRGAPIGEGKMIISPDGVYFPIEALVTRITAGSIPEYLIENVAISYTYSARFLLQDDKKNQQTGPTFVGFAPSSFSAALGLSVLPQSDASLNRVSALFDQTKVFVGHSATRKEFLNNYHRYKIVQLYTHATESTLTGDPLIYFSDSALKLSELVAEKHPLTRLIVLSACETGKGKLYAGEGVFSFNRIFAEAGVPSALVNLWAVDNRSAYEMTELFMENIAKGLTSDEALRQAKLRFIGGSEKEMRLPYYWAAPVLAGQVLSLHPVQNWYADGMYLFVTALMALASIVIFRTNVLHGNWM